MYPFVIYEKALMPHEFPRMFADAALAGYDGFELSVDESDERLNRLCWPDKVSARVARAAQAAGVRLQSVCFSGQRRFPMGSRDPKVVKDSLEMMRRCIALSAALGVRVLQVAGYDVYYEPPDADTMERYLDNLAKAARVAEEYGVMLAIEPVEKGIKSVTEALCAVRRVSSPWLQVYPDVANMAALGIDPAPELMAGKGHIVQVHVRDALPQYFYGVELGRGILDFAAVFRSLGAITYSGPCTVEMWNLDNENYLKIITEAKLFLTQQIEAVQASPLSSPMYPITIQKEVSPYV